MQEEDGSEPQRLVRATEERKIFSQFHIPVGAAYACGNNSLNVYTPRNSSSGEEYDYQFFGLQVHTYILA